jgi:hypothetical protein
MEVSMNVFSTKYVVDIEYSTSENKSPVDAINKIICWL